MHDSNNSFLLIRSINFKHLHNIASLILYHKIVHEFESPPRPQQPHRLEPGLVNCSLLHSTLLALLLGTDLWVATLRFSKFSSSCSMGHGWHTITSSSSISDSEPNPSEVWSLSSVTVNSSSSTSTHPQPNPNHTQATHRMSIKVPSFGTVPRGRCLVLPQ